MNKTLCLLLLTVSTLCGETMYGQNAWGFGLSELRNSLNEWSKSGLVTVDTFGRTVKNNPMCVVTIKKPTSTPRYRISIHARTHPIEVQSTHVAKEMISILLSGSEIATKLLDSCVFNIVPLYNVDGTELGTGYERFNSSNIDIESNWYANSPEKEVQSLKNLYLSYMQSETPTTIALNLHSDYDCKRFFVVHAAQGTSDEYFASEKRFVALVKNNWLDGFADWDYQVTWTTSTPLKYPESWFWQNYGSSVLALTYEDMNCSSAGEYNRTASAILNGIGSYLNLVKTTDVALNPKLEGAIRFANPMIDGNELRCHVQTNNTENGQLTLFDAAGKEIISTSIETNELTSISLPNGAKGLFFIVYSSSENHFAKALNLE